MIKRIPSKTVVRRKLVVRRETISQLTPRQLEQATGGWSVGQSLCTGTQHATDAGCDTTQPD